MSIFKSIYNNIEIKKKYNTLLLKYEILQEELDKKTVQLNTERRINLKRKKTWEKALADQEAEIIELKKRRRNVGNSKRSKDNGNQIL